MRKSRLAYSLSAAAILLLCSFMQIGNEPRDECKYTFLRTNDFTSRSMEVSNVFRVPENYTPVEQRYRYSLYPDSSEAETARVSQIHSARKSRYQVVRIHQADQCSK